MSSFIVRDKIGLPVWDDDRVVDIKHFPMGSTITTEDFETARQDEDEQTMLIQYNCYTADEISEMKAQEEQAAVESAFVTSADQALPSQEDSE